MSTKRNQKKNLNTQDRKLDRPDPDNVEERLDEGIEESFPASDSPTLTRRDPRTERKKNNPKAT